MKALKDSNLKVESQCIKIRNLRLKVADLRRKIKKQSTGGTSKKSPKGPPSIVKHKSKIQLYAKKFSIMNKIFVPDTAFLVPNPNYNPLDADRYKELASILKGIIAELFEEVPSALHMLMEEHSFFQDTVSTPTRPGLVMLAHLVISSSKQ